jgi:Ca2+/Na+ antiporter
MFPSIEPSETGFTGLVWLFATYGYVLFRASDLISEGSELLLLIPSWAGLVGGVVLPLLGAVPDGAIMLFSGIGDISTAQESLSVGVGALAGSTIMLLTIPWALSILAGRVSLQDDPNDPNTKIANYRGKAKGIQGKKFNETGVSVTKEIKHGSLIMILTTAPYFLIQIPASIIKSRGSDNLGSDEKVWAFLSLLVSVTGFVMYLQIHIKASREDEQKYRRMEVMKELLQAGKVSLGGAFHNIIEAYDDGHNQSSPREGYESISRGSDDKYIPSKKVEEYLKSVLTPTFQRLDKDQSDGLDRSEVKVFLSDFHEAISDDELDTLFTKYDKDGSNNISYDEFIHLCYAIVIGAGSKTTPPSNNAEDRFGSAAAAAVTDEDGEEEEEEIPEDIADLKPEEQQAAIKKKAFTMLGVGTFMVLLFSDPMVDVMQEIAVRADISPFYVSFILAPLASNASEVLASQYYASKKTTKTITVSLSTLQGAAAMNNTFCLSIFFGLICFRNGLAWQYTAETIAIVLVQFAIYYFTRKSVMTSVDAIKIMCIFPLSIVLVASLEAVGFD